MGLSQAVDHSELGDVIQTIPPNGPFWQYGTIVMRRRAEPHREWPPLSLPIGATEPVIPAASVTWTWDSACMPVRRAFTRAHYTSGKYCGACHDGGVAFSVRDGGASGCDKCHMKDTQALEAQFETLAATLPQTKFGNGIDWANALENGKIHPKNSISGADRPLSFPKELSKPIKLGTARP